MGMMQKTGRAVGYVINFRVDQWLGIDTIKGFAKLIIGRVRLLIKPVQAEQVETFTEATQRLKLTPTELKRLESHYSQYLLLFMAATLGAFAYSLYLAYSGNLLGFLIGFSLTIFGSTQVFRYHFWLYQLKHKKLGCSLQEWLDHDSTR